MSSRSGSTLSTVYSCMRSRSDSALSALDSVMRYHQTPPLSEFDSLIIGSDSVPGDRKTPPLSALESLMKESDSALSTHTLQISQIPHCREQLLSPSQNSKLSNLLKNSIRPPVYSENTLLFLAQNIFTLWNDCGCVQKWKREIQRHGDEI